MYPNPPVKSPSFFLNFLTKSNENFVDLQFCALTCGNHVKAQITNRKNMKQFATFFSSKKLIAVLVVLFSLLGVNQAYACHGVAIVTPTGTLTPTDFVINGSSDPATCGCGPYWMEVELTCNPAGFTGTPPAPSSPLWGTQPWYHSTLNPPAAEDCVLEPYFPVTIPLSQLCPGTQYYWRVREFVEVNSAGPWSSTFTFTTPGLPPAAVMVATSELLSTGNPQYSGCPGDLFQLEANVSGGCPGAVVNYTWTPATGLSNPNIANPVCTLATNITYTVTASGGCFTITSSDDTVNLAIGPPPIAGTPQAFPTGVCSGQSAWVVLSGQTPGTTIQWQVSPNGTNWFNVPGGTNDSLNTGPISSSLFYQAIVTGSGWPGSGCGSSTSPTVQVTVNPSPVANAGQNISICAGGTANLTGSGGVTYTWQPGNLSGSNVSVTPSGNTTYTLYVTDASGCSDSDMVSVNISIPTVTASPSVSVCNGNSTVIVASGSSGMTYSWSPAGTLTGANTQNPTATPTATTTYTVVGTNSFGCTATDSVLVSVTTAPPLTVSNDTSLCNGGAAVLTASGASTYTWQPGNLSGSSISVSPVTTTTYVVVGNTNNCISNDTIIVTVAPPLAVYAGPDFGVCAGTQITMNVGVSGGTYSWTPAASIVGSTTGQSVIANPTGTTSYTVNVTDANGCVSADTITVTVNGLPNVTASTTDNTICVGQGSTVAAAGASSYVWTPNINITTPNAPGSMVNPTSTTTYTVTGTDGNGCQDTAQVTIYVNPTPNVLFSSVASECGDTSGIISVVGPTAGTGPFTYTMNSQPVIFPLGSFAPGSYNVTYTDANGCTNMNAVFVYQQNSASVQASANPTFGTYPLPVTFGAQASSGVNNFGWTFGDASLPSSSQNPSHTYGAPGVYEVVVTAWNDDPNCAVTDTIYIEVVEQATLAMPNVFTPNADNTNDVLAATISGVKEINIEIFNRWGNVVYSGSQSGISPVPQDLNLWDGKSKGGKVCEDGVYYYVLTAIGYDTKAYPMQGFVQLITTP